jgi:hypothetical protein
MYGLVGCSGNPMKKPWSISSNTSFMQHALNLLCDSSHPHDQVRGEFAKRSEGVFPRHRFTNTRGFQRFLPEETLGSTQPGGA